MSDDAEEAAKYYAQNLGRYPRTKNEKAITSYGVNTEPGERPNHRSILSTKKLRLIQAKMLTDLTADIARNSRLAFVFGTPLAPSSSTRQPLAERGEKWPR